jgi:hypothetical protein
MKISAAKDKIGDDPLRAAKFLHVDLKGRATEHPVKSTHPMRSGEFSRAHGLSQFRHVDLIDNPFPPPLSSRLYDADRRSSFSLYGPFYCLYLVTILKVV